MNNLSTDSTAPSRTELRKQLDIVKQSHSYLGLIIFSVVLSYYVLGIQKRQLECRTSSQDIKSCECLPETEQITLIASILIIIALRYFFCLSVQTSQAACNSGTGTKAANRNMLASFLVLAAAILRFWNLIEST